MKYQLKMATFNVSKKLFLNTLRHIWSSVYSFQFTFFQSTVSRRFKIPEMLVIIEFFQDMLQSFHSSRFKEHFFPFLTSINEI